MSGTKDFVPKNAINHPFGNALYVYIYHGDLGDGLILFYPRFTHPWTSSTKPSNLCRDTRKPQINFIRAACWTASTSSNYTVNLGEVSTLPTFIANYRHQTAETTRFSCGAFETTPPFWGPNQLKSSGHRATAWRPASCHEGLMPQLKAWGFDEKRLPQFR